jgi:hypothetical protein
MNEEMGRLIQKAHQWGDRPLTGNDLARLIEEVKDDMRAAYPDANPYDASAHVPKFGGGHCDRS